MTERNDTFIHREQGKKWLLPKVLTFGNRFQKFPSGNTHYAPNLCEYEIVGYRNPKKGEWFLSGAQVEAWEAFNDQSTPMLIAKPTIQVKAVTKTVYEPI